MFKRNFNKYYKKLDKLDVIEQLVNNLQATLLKLEERTQTLESFQTQATKDNAELQQSLNFTEAEYKSNLESLTKQYKQYESIIHNLKIASLSEPEEALKEKIKELETKNLYLGAYSRRENIKLENIAKEGNKENTEHVLRAFLETELGFLDANTVEIQRVHRLGKRRTVKARPILARFLRYKDCERILSLGSRLRGTNYMPHEFVLKKNR